VILPVLLDSDTLSALMRGNLTAIAHFNAYAVELEYNLTLFTNNTRHFDRIPALHIQNWLLPFQPATP
jgi:hypothetical protein